MAGLCRAHVELVYSVFLSHEKIFKFAGVSHTLLGSSYSGWSQIHLHASFFVWSKLQVLGFNQLYNSPGARGTGLAGKEQIGWPVKAAVRILLQKGLKIWFFVPTLGWTCSRVKFTSTWWSRTDTWKDFLQETWLRRYLNMNWKKGPGSCLGAAQKQIVLL